MAELSLPIANINRILKKALPEGFHASKEVRIALSRAAATFILYISTIGGDIALENQGKLKVCKLKPEHLMTALEETDFGGYCDQLAEPNLKRKQV